mgnify:CR=1 FL=1
MRLRHVLVFACALVLTASLSAAAPQGRVVILGFDGVDPGISKEMMEKGELPNLKQLAEQGTFKPLESSNPPQSPTAWSNFATCRTPVNHGIFDFLRRDPKTYFPGVGFGITKHPELAPDGALAARAEYQTHREGETFWKVASDQGLKVKALVVPFAYPAEDLSDHSCQLCGLDVPDIRGTQSTYFSMAEDYTEVEPVSGGMRIPLNFSGDTATVEIPGIGIPGKRRVYAKVPVTVTADRDAGTVTMEVQGAKATLAAGEWSEWMEWDFPLSEKYGVKAISRYHLLEAGENVRLYMTCLQIHPREPMMPISTPEAYSAELADRYGLYKTVGWAYDTKALQHDDLTEDLFLDDVRRTMAWRKQLCLDELDRGNFDMLLAAWTATDRVSHLFWRFRDPKHPLYTEEGAKKYGRAVEETYTIMDEIVGAVMERLEDGDLLMLMSDHGFHSFRYGFSVNTWLVRNGYLAIKDQTDPATAFTDQKYMLDFDWPNTRAYALGLGMVFLNRQGREGQGTVAPDEVPGLIEEIKAKLLQETDPNTGDKIFRNIYTNVNPEGAAALHAPDLQLGYDEGYQTAKPSAAGAAPKELITPNLNKWSGEHASSDKAFTPGIFFANQPFDADPSLLDLGVTALEYLGAKPLDSFEGKSLLPQ